MLGRLVPLVVDVGRGRCIGMGAWAKERPNVARVGCPVFESERGHELYERRKRGHRDEVQRNAEGSRDRATKSMIGQKGEVYNAPGITLETVLRAAVLT